MTMGGQNNIGTIYAGYLNYFIPLLILVKTGAYVINVIKNKSALHGGLQ